MLAGHLLEHAFFSAACTVAAIRTAADLAIRNNPPEVGRTAPTVQARPLTFAVCAKPAARTARVEDDQAPRATVRSHAPLVVA